MAADRRPTDLILREQNRVSARLPRTTTPRPKGDAPVFVQRRSGRLTVFLSWQLCRLRAGLCGRHHHRYNRLPSFSLVSVAGSVQSQNFLLASFDVRPGRRIAKSLCADLPQRGAACRISSTLTLLSRNDAHAQDGKGYCYCPRYRRFNGEFHDG